ncbi:VOC family protein [Pseudorhodobacter sp.]|uniref:VOC family protein n=1 Tax=Pseudorhodobacter sp. TaxID=1934400 RepID=UPI002647DC27|nr:VOC family protein [Pseudorhodobacter sp.]MDN5787057.1 VOC family protein [Pseudorhodobacter sp.]
MTDTIADAISGIYETHLPVSDLSRSIAFYRDILGLQLAHEVPSRGAAFFWAGAPDRGMLGLWQCGFGPLRMTGHFAFRIGRNALLAAPAMLQAHGIAPLGFHGEPASEPVVIGWMPALSLYFKDPDGHSLEFVHLLDAPADPGFGIGTWSDWRDRG